MQGSGWEQQWGGAAALAGCMGLGKGGQMFGRWGCHSGGGARGQGGAMQVCLQVGCPWAGQGGPRCSEGCPAMLPCPAAGRWGGVVPVPGGSCCRHVSLLGETMQGRDPHPGGFSRGGLGGARRNPSSPPARSALPEPLCPTPRCSPKPPRRARPPPCRVLETGPSPRAGGKRRGRAKGLGGRSSAGAEAAPVASPGASGTAGAGSGVGEAGGLRPLHPMPRSLSMRTVGRGVAGGCLPPVPSWPSRRSPQRRPGEGSGGGGGGWAGCPRCRLPPRAGPASRRDSVGMAVSGVGTDPMHPVPSSPLPSTARPQKPSQGHPAPCDPARGHQT